MRIISLVTAFLCLTALASSADDSTDVVLDVSGGQLGATLLHPDGEGPWPVVLILAGSGPVDRDGNIVSFPGKSNSLRQLAEGLAQQGVASLRTDKRGVGISASAALSEKDMRFTHFIDDAVQWTFWLQNDKRFSSVSIAGHSQGAQVGMSAAWQAGADGFVSLAGPGRTVIELLREQLAGNFNIRSRIKANDLMDELEAGRTVPEPATELSIIFRPSVQEFLISWNRQNPQRELKRLSCPATIIQGLNDLQVKEDDAQLLKEAKPGATLVLLPGINHLFKLVEGDNPVVHQMASVNQDLLFSQDAIDAVAALATEADSYHKVLSAALDRAAEFNAEEMQTIPLKMYDPGPEYDALPMGLKISHWIENRSRNSLGYRFGLAEDGYAADGRLMTKGFYDCVSFMYRCTELARAGSPRDDLAWALRTRFAGADPASVVRADGSVDYDLPEHLDFSLDMIRSEIWGRDASEEVGLPVADGLGTHRYPANSFSWIPTDNLDHEKLKEGDIVWFVLNPENKKARALRDEYGLVVGHLGLMVKYEGRILLAHAASSALSGEYEGGNVVHVELATYLERVDRYAGVMVTRLD